MKHHALDPRKLVYDPREEFPAYVSGWLQVLKRARAGLAEQVAAIGGFQIEAYWIAIDHDLELRISALEVAIRHSCVNGRISGQHSPPRRTSTSPAHGSAPGGAIA